MKSIKIIIKQYLSLITLTLAFASYGQAQSDTAVYNLSIKKEKVKRAGKDVIGMTVNGNIPGPTIRFKEGGYAIIFVKNEMDVETSVHWHGLLLPNFYDGVPYLTTPPIKPGETQKYEFPLIQSGTYWYHSHTMLQEQSGVYGSIVIDAKKETLEYDKELVMVLSDWTNQKPINVLRNLKRGNEWYNIKKGTATPLNRVIARGGFGAQLNFWKQRMESADVADIYYQAFLNNGQQVQEYSQFEPGEKVRVRIINGAASSQFWMTFGGETPLLVAADGLNVVPIKRNKTFIAVAENYDFIVTIPAKGKIEFRATAQDGSGYSSAYLGKGQVIQAPEVARPDKIGMMMMMDKMDMRMGAPAMKFRPGKEEPEKLIENWGMYMDEEMNMEHNMNHHDMKGHEMMSDTMMPAEKMPAESMDNMNVGHNKDHHVMKGHEMISDTIMDVEKMPQESMDNMDMYAEYNYDYLMSLEKTNFSQNKPVKELLLNLTGNMWRYIWSINGIPLSEADLIKIEKGQVVRITLNNLTMMHHPMHLHGHFFRVINKNGDYSPLKHTVNVPPMQKVVIEFDASESGDWFFHCHVLYHMVGGMARVYSYDTPRDPRMVNYPIKKLTRKSANYYSWGMIDIASHMSGLNLVSSNTRNQFNMNVEFGYNLNIEGEITYERYLYDYFRVFAGVNIENSKEKSLEDLSTKAIAGFRYLTPYMFNLDVRIDNRLRPELRINRSIMVFPRTVIFGNYEYRSDFGWVNNLTEEGTNKPINYLGETVWSVGVQYLLSRNFSLIASYDNRFGAGGGLSTLF